MSTYTCVQLREVAPELALGVLGGAERAEALIHLTNCTRCQAYVAELTEAADTIPLLANEHEPPPGFEQRVLAGLGSHRRRTFRRWAASVAVAVAASAILSITIVRVIDARNEPSTVAGESPTLVQVRMVSETGQRAGWASVSGRRSVALAVDYGIEPGNYDIEVRPTGGKPAVIGDMTVSDDEGWWRGESQVPIDDGSTISLVNTEGAQVCHGTVESTR